MGRAVSVIVVTACSCAVGNGTRWARTAPGWTPSPGQTVGTAPAVLLPHPGRTARAPTAASNCAFR